MAAMRCVFAALVCAVAVWSGAARADIVYEFIGTCTQIVAFDSVIGPNPPCSALSSPFAHAVIHMPDSYVPGQPFHSQTGNGPISGTFRNAFPFIPGITFHHVFDFVHWDASGQFPETSGPGTFFHHGGSILFETAADGSWSVTCCQSQVTANHRMSGINGIWRRVPEPGSLLLVMIGALGLISSSHRLRHRS